jgi:hypothetical protein
MSKETEKESMFQSFQKTVSSHMTNAKAYVTQKIPFFSNAKDNAKDKASTDSFADPPPPETKNYTVLATTLTDAVAQLQALPSDSKGLRDVLTKVVAILQDLKGTLLQGDPSIRDKSHASAITDVIQNLEKLSNESATTVNTSNVTTVIAIATTTLNTVASTMTQVSASGIFNKIIEIIQQLFYPLLILYLASLVSNEMIVYPAPIRFLFFFFVLTLCSAFSPATVILVFYYLVKAGYSYYRNHLEERDGDTTEIRIYPRIFALLPITTTPGESLLGRFFKYPFHYPKTEKDRKELERTDGKVDGKGSIMDEYMEVLKESFPYGETVKGSDPFAERYERIEKNIKRIHQAPAVPVVPAVPVPTTTSADNLPPTIGSKGTPSRTLPTVIVPKESSSGALPATIVPPSSNVSNVSKTLPSVIVPNASKALPAVIASKALPAVIASKAPPSTIATNGSNGSKALPSTIAPNNSKALPSTIAPNGSNGSKALPAVMAPKEMTSISAIQKGGTLKTRSPTSGGWLWNGI